jgi:nucleotide-binding universal stress UspA family protein
MAKALNGPLHVLRVVPDALFGPAFPRLRALDAHSVARRVDTAKVQIHAWLRQQLGADAPLGNVRVQTGDFVQQVAARARALDVALIVVAPGERRLGATVTSLARAAERPVLVARQGLQPSVILAATDLQDTRHEVLSRAADFGSALHAPIFTFHNSDPLGAVGAAGLLSPDALVLGGQTESHGLARLQAASQRLPVDATPVMRTEIDPVHAILDEARARGVDIVVVGTHRRRGWWERALRGSVASHVVGRASQSVMVTPIPDPAQVGGSSC